MKRTVKLGDFELIGFDEGNDIIWEYCAPHIPRTYGNSIRSLIIAFETLIADNVDKTSCVLYPQISMQ